MSLAPSNKLFVFNKNNEIIAQTLNYNFSYLENYIYVLSTDASLISSLASSTTLADLVSNSLLESDSLFIASIAEELSGTSEFYGDLVDQFILTPSFFTSLVNNMESDVEFLTSLSTYLNGDDQFVNNVGITLALDTRGVNTRTDISGTNSTMGGVISYLATDSGTIRTKKSDATSVAAVDYSTNSIYEVTGSFWCIEVNADGNTFEIYRYDSESDYNIKHSTLKDEYLAGPTGTVGAIYKSIQFIDTSTCIEKTDGNPDKTTGRIFEYLYSSWTESTALAVGYEKVYTISLRVLSTSANETFTFQTYNINVSDNGFVTNVANAMVSNDNLTHEIAQKVVENPSFVTELSQNLQKVEVRITTEEIGAGITSGNYYDDTNDTAQTDGFVIDDYTVTYDLTPHLSENIGSSPSNPWIVGEVSVQPYLNTSGADIGIVGLGIDTSGGCYLDLESTPVGGVGNAVVTNLDTANRVAYIRGKTGGRVYLANENNALQAVDSWAKLGWAESFASGDLARFLDTLDSDPNFDIKIYKDDAYSETIYESTNNIYPLSDIRQFNYYPNVSGKVFLEIKNNLGEGLGNPNIYKISIYGYKLTETGIHNHVYNESIPIDGVTKTFYTNYSFILNSTRIVQQHYPLQLSIDYSELPTGNGVLFSIPPSGGEWCVINYERN